MTPLNFLNLLWEFKPEELYVLLWTLPDKRSRWFRDIAAAAEFVLKAHGSDVYVGVGLSGADRGPGLRCASEEIAGICGFWADLDLRSDAHDNKALPATIQDALSIIPVAMPPTIVIDTGNGAHAWWIFKEPYIFDGDEDHQAVASQVARWHTLLRLTASSLGWSYDRLSDLARVLRIPGTRNLKDPAKPEGCRDPLVLRTALQPLRFRRVP
jgi:putative DNA primase/helicase